jgi:metallo-beta-lactamase family protein
MLRDSAHIQMFEAEWRSRKSKRRGTGTVEPMYDMDDAENLLSSCACKYDDRMQILENMYIRFVDVGHLLGPLIEVWITEEGKTKKIVFSGDIGNSGQRCLRTPSP